MSMLNKVFIGALLLTSLSSCSKNSGTQEEKEGFNFELQIIDSIQVDVMERITAMDFNNGNGVVSSNQNNQITLFDADGKTLKSQTYPKEGPGSIVSVTNLRLLDNGDIVLYPSFGNRLIILDADLEMKKIIEMPFPSELLGLLISDICLRFMEVMFFFSIPAGMEATLTGIIFIRTIKCLKR